MRTTYQSDSAANTTVVAPAIPSWPQSTPWPSTSARNATNACVVGSARATGCSAAGNASTG